MRSLNRTCVFTPEFLYLLAHRERPSPTSPEAEYAGPWRVLPREQSFVVFRESDGEHGLPNAEFNEHELALLVAAVYPTIGREKRFRTLKSDGEDNGFDVQVITGGQLKKIGWIRHDHLELLDALHVVECLLRSPAALAAVLEATSYEVLSRAGSIVEQHLSEEEQL